MITGLLLTAALSADTLSLARFDGSSADFKWVEENDPVMGGVSTNCTFTKDGANSVAAFVGTVEIVPSLKAPGFCFARTMTTKSQFADASAFTHLDIEYTSTVAYAGFKAAFAADTLIPQFQSFKADFNVTAGSGVASIPFSAFSNKWDAATGEPTKHSPPTAKNLRDISQLQVWAEGVQGPFNLQIKEIRASNGAVPSTTCAATEYCCPDAKKCLTPTSTSCKDDATACGDGEVCCPLTKICVKPGADCQTPCSDSGTYCCPDAKACLKPTNPGVFCTSAADCGAKSGLVCCPLTKLCVAPGDKCSPP